MKSTLAITAGCLFSALAVGDTVYHIAPRPGRTYSDVAVAAKGGLGDISQLTDQDDDLIQKNLDDLFADETKDGIDADELASIRELALVAKPHDSSWGADFFKDADGNVGGVSPYTLARTTGAWDSTLGTSMATSATTGPMSYFAGGGMNHGLVDQFCLSGNGPGSSLQYGGDAGSGAIGSNRPAAIVSSLGVAQIFAVPEPATASIFAFGALSLLIRRRRAR